MATTTDLTTLKINYLSQAQYDNALANNQINPNELYFTPADNGITLNVNGQSTSSPSFYAPTSGGTADTQTLVSGGASTAPKWVDISPSITITDGDASNAPKINVTTLGQSGTTQSLTKATIGVYGVTKLSSTASSTEEGLAATPKGVSAAITNAINALDYTNSNSAVNKTPTSITQTDGKIAVTYSDIGSLDASTITSGTLPTGRGGTGNTSYDANRVIYSENTTKLSASGHYASSTALAINSTSAPAENFYVEGTSRFGLGTSDNTGNKKFVIGSSGRRYLSFGGAGVQAYDASNNASTLYLNYYGGDLRVGQAGYDGRVILDTTTAASNSTTPSLRVMQNAQITSANVNHMAQFLASNMETGGANAIVLGKAVSSNQAGGLLYTYGGTSASSLSFGFVNNLGLLKITSSGSIYINSGSSGTHNTTTSELLVKGRVVVDPSYHNTNNFSEFRINRSTAGWSAITLGGAQGTTSGAGLGVWLIGSQNTPTDATTAAANITDSKFYISYNGSASAPCRIQGHNADGFSIRPRLAVNANVNTDYSLYVNGTSLFFGRVISNTAATDAIVVEHGTANKDAGITVRRTDTGTAVWMGVGASGAYGLYSPALTSWMIYGDTSGVYVNGNAATATAAKLTTTTNAIAYYTNTTGTFGTKASANGALYATAANGALQWGTLPVAQGGTGATTAAAARANLGTLGSKLVGTFEGMTTMSGDDTKWIRTTTTGIIPYENGGAGSGHSALGTATWYFADAYVDHMHGVDIVTNQAGAGQGLQIQSNSKRVAQLYLYTRGTTSVTGSAQFILGNNIATGTAENAAGMIQIHGTSTGYHRIQPTDSTSNYSHYLPNSTGWIATGGNGTSTGVGSASQPVYLSSAGVLTACTCYEVVQHTGDGTTSMSLTFSFAPDIIIVLSPRGINYFNTDGTVDNQPTNNRAPTRSYNYVLMSNVTTSYVALDKNWMSVGQQDGQGLMRQVFKEGTSLQWAYTGTFVGYPVQHKKSSNGKQYFLQINSTINAQFSNNYGPWNIWNETGLVSTFLGIKF